MDYEQVKALTIRVTNASTQATLGTAFFVSNYGHLLTCTHVIESGGGIDNVHFNSTPAELVISFPANGLDISIVKLDQVSQPVELGCSFEPRDQFLTFGYGRDDFNGATMQGEITDINNFLETPKIRLLVSGGAQAIIGGYSGAPIYNEDTGKVIGVISEFDNENGGLAIPIRSAIEQINSIEKSPITISHNNDSDDVIFTYKQPHSSCEPSQIDYLKGDCPYCNAQNRFEKPSINNTILLNDVEFLPYSRDIGRFDNGNWSRIGQDFYKSLNWDKKIGILRVEYESCLIYYKVAKCRICEYKFDVYANYTPGKKLYELWHHLLSKPNNLSELSYDIPRNSFFFIFEPIREFLDGSSTYANLAILACIFLLLPCSYFLQSFLQSVPPYYSLIEFLSIKLVGIVFLGFFLVGIVNNIEIFRGVDKFFQLFIEFIFFLNISI